MCSRARGVSVGGRGQFMEVPLGSKVARTGLGILSPSRASRAGGISAGRVGKTSLSAEIVDEQGHLTKALKIEQMRAANGRRGRRGDDRIVGHAERHGGMAAIGQPHDDVRACAVADTDDGQLLSAERVMGMRDGHASRRELGRGGSALGICRRSTTGLYRKPSVWFWNPSSRLTSISTPGDSVPTAARWTQLTT